MWGGRKWTIAISDRGYYIIPGSGRQSKDIVAQHFLDCRDLTVDLGFAKM